jgi:hypothetical protein
MQKVKCSESAKLRGFVKDFGEGYFSSDGRILFSELHELKLQLISDLMCNNIVIRQNIRIV